MDIHEYFRDTINIKEYVAGNTALFEEEAFNNVDSLVLCQLFYPKLEAVLDGDRVSRIDAGYTVRDFWKNEYANLMFSDDITDRDNTEIYSLAAASRRFRDIRVKNLVSSTTAADQKQFAAVAYEIDDKTDYVCFRGTDGSLLGWKEDFNLSYMREVPSQKCAVEYLNEFYGPGSTGEMRRLYVGGHSKGGNLAIYGSAFCADEVRDRIILTYSLDGPGFRDEVAEKLTAAVNADKLRIHKIVPQSSLIGMLLQTHDDYKVIRSKAVGGIMQHAAFNWQIEDGDFQYLDGMSLSGMLVDHTIHDWLQMASDDQREKFSDALFGILFDNGIETVHELKHISPREFAGILKSYKDLDAETKDAVFEMLKELGKASVGQLLPSDQL